MRILAIETSCDDTCIAILEIRNWKLEILSNVVSSQVKLHAKYGGVYPFLAKREHQKNLPIVLKKALKGAGNVKIDASANSASTLSDNRRVDLIAVTIGPGLEPCLWTGINFAVDLAKKIKVSLIPINHIEAHIMANFISQNSKLKIQNSKLPRIAEQDSLRGRQFKIKNLFPAICLVVSGGHTQLILMKGLDKYKVIGETRDDAAGECFDKTARILGLGYPGGPAIARLAEQWKSKTQNPKSKINSKFQILNSKLAIGLPRPMLYQKNYDFSFSGLKTAVLYDFKGRGAKIKKSKQYIQAMAAEIQQAVIDVLIRKTIIAAKNYKVKSIILAGGVAANKELRKQFQERIRKETPNSKFYIPDPKLCTDNAVMIAVAGYLHQKSEGNWKKIKADANLRIR